uniref:Putative homing endonuclease n=1 Tax=viral metagenome TaxID=1070528 RepID=A0A6M3ILP2_9ZZZZ
MVKKKLCKKCGIEKPLVEMVKNKICKDGYTHCCKKCGNKLLRQKYLIDKKPFILRTKKCREKNKEKYSLYAKKYHEENRGRINARHRQHYLKNREAEATRKRKYNQENKEKNAIRAKKYRDKNKAIILAKNKVYYQKNKDKIRGYRKSQRGKSVRKICENRRRQRKRNLATDHDLTNSEWLDIVYSQDHICAGKCHRRYPTSRLTVDHIYPLSRGGRLVKENVQALCKRCNSSKGNKLMKNWVKEW